MQRYVKYCCVTRLLQSGVEIVSKKICHKSSGGQIVKSQAISVFIMFSCWLRSSNWIHLSRPNCTQTLIPLFQTGHESPESPRIDFLFIRGGGGFVRFHYFFFSNRDVLRVSPDSDTISLRIFGGIGSIRLESRKNSLRLANNIRSCCTKVKESITNQLRICRMQHELGTN